MIESVGAMGMYDATLTVACVGVCRALHSNVDRRYYADAIVRAMNAHTND